MPVLVMRGTAVIAAFFKKKKKKWNISQDISWTKFQMNNSYESEKIKISCFPVPFGRSCKLPEPSELTVWFSCLLASVLLWSGWCLCSSYPFKVEEWPVFPLTLICSD